MQIKAMMVVLGLAYLAAGASAQTTVTNNNDGAADTIPVYTGGATLGNSPIAVSGANVGIGTSNPGGQLTIGGANNVSLTFQPSSWGGWRAAEIHGIDAGSNFRGQLAFFTHGAGGSGTDAPTERMRIDENGNVGIGTTTPGASLEVNGNVKLTSGSGASVTFADGTVQSTAYTGVSCGGDFAESVDVSGLRKSYEPGDVLVIDPQHPGKFLEAAQPYSTLVAGIYSTKPGYVGRRLDGPKSPDEVPMAMVGIVPLKVTAENGPIHTGDLLVTSSTPGRAMKGTDRSRLPGAVVGKALADLSSGQGVIEALVTLQ